VNTISDEKLHIQHRMRYEKKPLKHQFFWFILGEGVVSHNTCKYWFQRYKTGDFDQWQITLWNTAKKIGGWWFTGLKNPSKTQEKFAEQLGV